MDVVTGALPSVLAKLGDLLSEYNLHRAVKGEILFLQVELECIQAALERISKIPADQLDEDARIWSREAKELSYDIEDNIDEFMVCGNGSGQVENFRKYIDRTIDLLTRRMVHKLKVQKIKKIHVTEALGRRDRFKVHRFVAKPATATAEPRLLELVGIDERRDELIKIVMVEDGVFKEQGKIVSIVGSGGLGKTTLAKVVYENLRPQFDCSAFVSVSQTPDVKRLFKSMLYQLGNGKNINEEKLDEKWLINELRGLLLKKRYFIVIDNMWSLSVWKKLRSALPDNNYGYKIVTTTRILNVAEQVGVAYKLKPLCLDHSRKLFYRIIFGTECMDKCLNEQLHEVSNRMLEKCAGVPLAIIMIANLLASKGRNKTEWYRLYNSIGTGLVKRLYFLNLTKILSLSYDDLPSHLKPCLLYLNMFPEDYEIEKDRLIWLWIAEGFIQCEKQEKCLFELGESYFNELINRSMIQPVYDKYSAMIEYYRVNDMVLNFVCRSSRVENHVTVMNGLYHTLPSQMVRRLSFQNSMADHAKSKATINMKQVRSVIVFPSAINAMPSLQSFRVLRVLDLQDCHVSEGCDLKYIGNLFQLRYLGLRKTCIDHLPEEIGNLQFLQTLDIRDNGISRLPRSVSQLRQLLCLRIDGITKVPNGIGCLTSLEELSMLCICNDSTNIINELVHVKELRVLHILYHVEWNDHSGKSLVECLNKMQKIQDLHIDAFSYYHLDSWVPPQHIRRLELTGSWYSTLQAWMKPSRLLHLSFLSMKVRKLQQEELEILGMLSALRYLSLTVDHDSLGITERFVVSSYLFPCLVHCSLFGFIVPMVFHLGAMPRLASIEFMFPVREMREIADSLELENLISIQNVTLFLNYGGGCVGDLEEAKVALRRATALHPNNPTLRIITCKRDIKSDVKKVREKHASYNIDGIVAKPVKTTVFPCLFYPYMKATELVGIEVAVNDLVEILTEGNDVSKEQGKIVSIVGVGGLGKTTLAHAIYGKLRAQFDCWAFVSVSQNPDMKKLFKCMLYQLGKKNNANILEEILDERLLVFKLIEYLRKKRYFIVIDDLWDISVWKMIRCALPTNNGEYRIITTTRIFDVAKQVGIPYKMRPLSLENSRILFHRRIFGTEDKDKFPYGELIEVSEKILQKCGGVPLAIIMIAGLLASKGEYKIEWYNKVYNSIGSTANNCLDVDDMRLILSLSYDDLPSHLRTCLLYLSVFPEGYDIDKDRLIRLWIAEGLIQRGNQEESLFELGESYFYELINRSMIRPVYKRWYYDMTEYCCAHDMVFELLFSLSCEENLVTIWNYVHHKFPSKEIQWLSFQNSMVDHATERATSINMQQVRTVVVFPSAANSMPALTSFNVLRVLDLQSCRLSQGYSLKQLGNLVHLRYLGLRETGIAHLSEEIGKLQFLQTLDVTGNEISSFPSTVVELKHWMCLRIDSWTRAPNGIGSFTSLEELSMLCIQDSTGIIEELENLTELRVLGIDCCTEWNICEVEKSLVECLHKLQKIRTLSISMVGECNLDAWVAPQHLRRLELTGCWPSTVPALLNDPSLLLELSFLSIEVRKLRQEDLDSLGRLPALRYLDIEVGNQKLGIVQSFIIGACSFPCLVHCTLRGYIGPVAFKQGAMPEVARLHLVFPVREIREAAGINNGGFDMGFGNLPRLQDVSFLLRRGVASKGEVEEAEAALRQAIESHPSRPTLEIL